MQKNIWSILSKDIYELKWNSPLDLFIALQAVGALGEPKVKSDFSLLARDGFSQANAIYFTRKSGKIE